MMSIIEKLKQILCDDLFYEDIIFTMIFNERKSLKGVLLKKFQCDIDEDSLIIKDNGCIEIEYPLSDIISFDFDNIDSYTITMLGGEKILLSTT